MSEFSKVERFISKEWGPNYYDKFTEVATLVTCDVFRAANAEEGLKTVLKIIKEQGYKSMVGTPLTLIDQQKLVNSLKEAGIKTDIGEVPRSAIEKAELGVSEFEIAVAETGSLAHDATDVYKRLVSSLVPYHIALVKTANIVPTFADALDILYKANGNQMSPYTCFISGPSRTADIERVLAIGVHGPEKLFVILID